LGFLNRLGWADAYLIDKMLIRIGYGIALNYSFPTAVIDLLHVHPSRRSDLLAPERFTTDPELPVEEYYDRFGNHRGRVLAPPGRLSFINEAVIRDSGQLDVYAPDAIQLEASEIPTDLLEFLLPSRYCEVDSELTDFAWRNFMQANLDGSEFKLSVISFTGICNLTTKKLAPIGPRSTRFESGSGFAAILRISPSHFADA
jgi:hypothetical protein